MREYLRACVQWLSVCLWLHVSVSLSVLSLHFHKTVEGLGVRFKTIREDARLCPRVTRPPFSGCPFFSSLVFPLFLFGLSFCVGFSASSLAFLGRPGFTHKLSRFLTTWQSLSWQGVTLFPFFLFGAHVVPLLRPFLSRRVLCPTHPTSLCRVPDM